MQIICSTILQDLALNIVGGFIGSAILCFALWLLSKTPMVSRLINPYSKKVFYPTLLFLCLCAYVAGGYALALSWPDVVILSFFLLPFFLLLPVFFGTFRFLSVGINDADLQINKGLDYHKALSLCHSQFNFLGTGASKLTGEDIFEEVLKRCGQEHPIRFLLLKPDDATLLEAAKRAEKNQDKFEVIVKESLRKLAIFKDRFKNIEVRFYNSKPIFRLMFIDETICLLSYNVFGKGDGSQLPQIIILNASSAKKKEKTLYYPLSQYFEDLWSCSDEWDFKEYVT